MTRGELKALIKPLLRECLMEMLSAESGDQSEAAVPGAEMRSAPAKARRVVGEGAQPRSSASLIRVGAGATRASPRVPDVSRITSDPIMAEVLADTAKTTLQERLRSDTPPGSSLPPGLGLDDPGIPVEDVFEGSRNWAALAFDSSSPRAARSR